MELSKEIQCFGWNTLSLWLIQFCLQLAGLWRNSTGKKKSKAFNIKQPFHVLKPSVLWLQPAESWCYHTRSPCPGSEHVMSWVQRQPQPSWFHVRRCWQCGSLLSSSSVGHKFKWRIGQAFTGSCGAASGFLPLLSSGSHFTGTFSITGLDMGWGGYIYAENNFPLGKATLPWKLKYRFSEVYT